MSDTENTTTSPDPYPVRDDAEPEGTEAAGGPGEAPDPDTEIIGWSEKMPAVPDEIREAARAAPDHWLGMIDPTWSGDGVPPDWAQVGRWRSGLDGEIVEWQDNEDYRPSPTALGWPEPADAVDAAVQLAATGYGPGEDVAIALAFHEVAVWTKPGGGPLPALTPEETPVVPVFTSPVHLHAAGLLAFELVKVPDLLDQVPEGHLLYVNPSGAVSMTIELHLLRERIEGTVPVRTAEEDQEATSAARPVTTVSGSPDTLDLPDASEVPESPDVSEVSEVPETPEAPGTSDVADPSAVADALAISDILGGADTEPGSEEPAPEQRRTPRPRTTSEPKPRITTASASASPSNAEGEPPGPDERPDDAGGTREADG